MSTTEGNPEGNAGVSAYGVGENYAAAPPPGTGDEAANPYAGLAPPSQGAAPYPAAAAASTATPAVTTPGVTTPGVTTPRPSGPVPGAEAPAWGARSAPVTPPPTPPWQQGSPYLTPGRGGYPGTYPSAQNWRAPRRSSGRGCLIAFFIVFTIIVTVIGLVIWGMTRLVASGGAAGQPTPSTDDTPPTALATTWSVTAQDLGARSGQQFGPGVDGAFTGNPFIAGDSVWIAAITDVNGTTTQLAGIAPDTGSALWLQDLPAGLCGDTVVSGQIMCMSRESGWRASVLDAATGAVVNSWDTGLDSVVTVHHTAAGLLVVGETLPEAPHATVSLLTPQGTTAWSLDIATVPGAEHLFDTFLAEDLLGQTAGEPTMERPRWRDLDAGLVMLWSTPGAAVIDPATGEIFAHECRRASTIGSAYFCADDAGIHRYALDGTALWTLPSLDLAVPIDGSAGRPLAVTGNHELVAVDWEAGTRGEVLHRFAQQPGAFTGTVLPPTAAGTAEHTIVLGDDAIVALESDTDAVLWTHAITEDDGYVGESVVVDGLVVAGSYDLVAFDALTGIEQWRGVDSNGIYMQPVGDQLGSIGWDVMALLELP